MSERIVDIHASDVMDEGTLMLVLLMCRAPKSPPRFVMRGCSLSGEITGGFITTSFRYAAQRWYEETEREMLEDDVTRCLYE